jgi:hypothetical protein
MEGDMNKENVQLERRGLAKGLKIWLDVLFLLLCLAAVALIVVWPALSIAGKEVYEISVPVALDEDALRLPEGAEGLTIDEAQGELKISPGHFGAAAAFWVFSVVFIGAFLYGLWLVRRILATTAEGFPFHPSNPRRLNHLGWVIVVTALGATVSQFVFGRWALARIGSPDLPISSTLNLDQGWLICGLLILVLASVWKQAVQMAEDQSLTV